jgi:hypothetical protein
VRYYSNWHRWFAWHPVSVNKEEGICAFMETVERAYINLYMDSLGYGSCKDVKIKKTFFFPI